MRKGKTVAGKLPVCPTCRKGGYTQGVNEVTGRPQFTCTRCGSTWTCGESGGEFAIAEPTDER